MLTGIHTCAKGVYALYTTTSTFEDSHDHSICYGYTMAARDFTDIQIPESQEPQARLIRVYISAKSRYSDGISTTHSPPLTQLVLYNSI